MNPAAEEFLPTVTFEQLLSSNIQGPCLVRFSGPPQLGYLRSLCPGGTVVDSNLFCTKQKIAFVPGEVQVQEHKPVCPVDSLSEKLSNVQIDYDTLDELHFVAALRGAPEKVEPVLRALVQRKHFGTCSVHDLAVLLTELPHAALGDSFKENKCLDLLSEAFFVSNLQKVALLFGPARLQELTRSVRNSATIDGNGRVSYSICEPFVTLFPCGCHVRVAGISAFWTNEVVCDRHITDPHLLFRLFRGSLPLNLLSFATREKSVSERRQPSPLDTGSIRHHVDCRGCCLDDL